MLRIIIPALLLSACGSARIIQMTPTGGTIELQDDRSKAMEEATNQMNKKCGPGNFTIVADGYESTSANTGSDSTAPSQQAWRIHFQCNGAIGSAPALEPTPAPAPPPPAPIDAAAAEPVTPAAPPTPPAY
jgi:hypothetical protein